MVLQGRHVPNRKLTDAPDKIDFNILITSLTIRSPVPFVGVEYATGN